MPSIFDPQVRTAIVDRISRLTPERTPVWGRFTAPEMVCHISCDLRQGLGELDAGPQGKGKSPPEFLATRPTTWAAGEPGLWIHFRPELGGHGVQTSGSSFASVWCVSTLPRVKQSNTLELGGHRMPPRLRLFYSLLT